MRSIKISFYFITLILISTTIIYGQPRSFAEFRSSRFARVIGMGDVYTGIADGIESSHYNNAGLSNVDGYTVIYSNGSGAVPLFDVDPNDFGVAIPFRSKNFILSFTLNTLRQSTFPVQAIDAEFYYNSYLYRLHFASKVSKSFSIGVSANYYYSKFKQVINYSSGYFVEDKGSSLDLTFSMLYKLNSIHLYKQNDRLQFGFQFHNILNSKTKYSNLDQEDFKDQNIRIGISYHIIPVTKDQNKLKPIGFLIGFDAIFIGTDYDFNLLRPNWGFEITLYEYVFIRYGRENEVELKDVYSYNLSFPVNRYGIGLRLPLWKLLKLNNELDINLDYSYSDWEALDESEDWNILAPEGIDQDAVSVSLVYKIK